MKKVKQAWYTEIAFKLHELSVAYHEMKIAKHQYKSGRDIWIALRLKALIAQELEAELLKVMAQISMAGVEGQVKWYVQDRIAELKGERE